MSKARGLGRGLDALLGDDAAPMAVPRGGESTTRLAVDVLAPGRYQPRTKMDADSLAALADSIKAQGLIQPILVRPKGSGRYEIIAGERRWRAAQLAGLAEVPVHVRTVDDHAALAMALIENIQREDLSPLEEASGIQRLIDEFGMTHEAAAQAVGRSRSAVSNLLRLLGLSAPVRALLEEGQLEMGHARALLALDGARQLEAARKIVTQQLSVRGAEALVARLLQGRPGRVAPKVDRDLARLQEELAETLGTQVTVKTGRKGAGTVSITYRSLDQLDALLTRFRR